MVLNRMRVCPECERAFPEIKKNKKKKKNAAERYLYLNFAM